MKKRIICALFAVAMVVGLFAGCSNDDVSLPEVFTGDNSTIEGSWQRVDKKSRLDGTVITVIKTGETYQGVIAQLSKKAQKTGFKVGDVKWKDIVLLDEKTELGTDIYEFADLTINTLDKERSFYKMRFLFGSGVNGINPYNVDEFDEDMQTYQRVNLIPVDEKYMQQNNLTDQQSEPESTDEQLTTEKSITSSERSYTETNTTKNATSANVPSTNRAEVKETTAKNNQQNSSGSYESIYNTYAAKIKAATPGVIQEYKAEAAKTSGGIDELAEILNVKMSKLAQICNDGIGEMAKLQYSSGGSYSEYETWCLKLQNAYSTEAQKLTDAYIESAM